MMRAGVLALVLGPGLALAEVPQDGWTCRTLDGGAFGTLWVEDRGYRLALPDGTVAQGRLRPADIGWRVVGGPLRRKQGIDAIDRVAAPEGPGITLSLMARGDTRATCVRR